MNSEDGEVYIMSSDSQGEEWVSPKPASAVIADAVTGETDLDDDDLEEIGAYVDLEELRGVLDGDEGSLTFQVEGHDVTLDADGGVEVDG